MNFIVQQTFWSIAEKSVWTGRRHDLGGQRPLQGKRNDSCCLSA